MKKIIHRCGQAFQSTMYFALRECSLFNGFPMVAKLWRNGRCSPHEHVYHIVEGLSLQRTSSVFRLCLCLPCFLCWQMTCRPNMDHSLKDRFLLFVGGFEGRWRRRQQKQNNKNKKITSKYGKQTWRNQNPPKVLEKLFFDTQLGTTLNSRVWRSLCAHHRQNIK